MKIKPPIPEIQKILDTYYVQVKTALHYASPFELVVAAILSTQCTDARVNIVTAQLFKNYKTMCDFASFTEEELIPYIKSCGLYRAKAKNLIAVSQLLIDRYNGKIPDTREELMKLPGIGRKVANVLLATIFNKPAFPVDTHVFRVARRLGLSSATTPLGVETDLTGLFPKDSWITVHHQLIAHGRKICTARSPKCMECPLREYCRYFVQTVRQNRKKSSSFSSS